MGKSGGKQFLLNIRPKYRGSVSLILEEKKKNREASEWVCQAILEKYRKEQQSLETLEEQVEQMIISNELSDFETKGGETINTVGNPNNELINLQNLLTSLLDNRGTNITDIPQNQNNDIEINTGEAERDRKIVQRERPKRGNSLLDKMKRQ